MNVRTMNGVEAFNRHFYNPFYNPHTHIVFQIFDVIRILRKNNVNNYCQKVMINTIDYTSASWIKYSKSVLVPTTYGPSFSR